MKKGKKPATEQNLPQSSHRGFKFSIRVNLHNYESSSGDHAVMLQVMVNRQRVRIPLNIAVPKKYWNQEKQKVLSGFSRANDLNLIIGHSLSKANKILVDARLKDQEITTSQFKTLFLQGTDTGSFLSFAFNELEKRKDTISPETFRTHRGDLSKLQDFRKPLMFADITPDLLESFARYMQVHLGNSVNTRHKTLKTVKTYVNIAIRKKKMFSNPFDEFKVRSIKTDRTYLEREEVERLQDLYNSPVLAPSLQCSLQIFLFSCFTGGIRIGDFPLLSRDNIVGDELVFLPSKTQEMSGIMVRVPLNDQSRKYMNARGPLFSRVYESQTVNRHLKQISKLAGLNKVITFHVARHTFAVQFLQMGGKVEVLQELMGHGKIETTMKYVHVSDQSRKEQMALFNQFGK